LDKLNNFNTLLAVSAGIGLSSIRRLKFTFSAIPTKFLDELKTYETRFQQKASYKIYRQHLRKATPPLIPYLYPLIRPIFSHIFIVACIYLISPSQTKEIQTKSAA